MQANATPRLQAQLKHIPAAQAGALHAANSRAYFIKRLIQSDCQRVTDCLAEHYFLPGAISVKQLLSYKSRLLELYRYVLSADLSSVETDILLGYLSQGIASLDDAMARTV
ncbi:hypothetical protein [Shewanella aegiceratis]|uniref:hypothetical protein n=1 Tax=Shewanella aegiceratis TaxID=2864203 RepID=UPI001C65AE85|nr:hypothetical protein [Shewanella aegiceratis]QYJ80725.1 hypothetical protein K0H80_10170 [Shewanella aegiceratis]